jgi:FADH2 O2-dependent halogenase
VTTDCDLAIIGSGFGGSILAMIARRLGLRVTLVERGSHPRFAIGESASPLAGVLVEQLADRYGLPRLKPLSAYGPWQRAYPDLPCGLKRGFSFFKHEEGRRYAACPDRSNQLLVAASPSDELSDTHWFRAEVDHFLVREAVALGAEYLDRVALDERLDRAGGRVLLSGRCGARAVRVTARLVVDASGARGFVSRAAGVADRGFARYPATQALYSHFTGVARCEDMAEYGGAGVQAAGAAHAPPACSGGAPPFPIDDAALHHVVDGGWMWVLRFNNGVTSAGVAVTDPLAAALRLADGAPAWARLLARYPSIAAQFAGAEPLRPFTWMPRLAWRVETSAGPGWAMLPSAAAFVDPLFSTGFPLTLLGVERLARNLERDAGSTFERPDAGLRVPGSYSDTTLAEADHAARLIAGCYAAFPRFADFASYSMFYFAAASFAEAARRLGAAGARRGFLMADDTGFASAVSRLSPAAGGPSGEALFKAVADAAGRFNVAGLCDPTKRNWYAVDVEDAVRGAARLGVGAARIRSVLSA